MPLQNFIWIIMHNKRIEYFFLQILSWFIFHVFLHNIFIFVFVFHVIYMIYFHIIHLFLSGFIIILSCDLFIITIHFSWFFHMIHLFPYDSLFSHLIPSHDSLFSQVILSHDSSIFTCDSFIRFAIHMIFFHPIYLLSFVILVVTQCLRLWTPVWKGIIFTYFHVILSYH